MELIPERTEQVKSFAVRLTKDNHNLTLRKYYYLRMGVFCQFLLFAFCNSLFAQSDKQIITGKLTNFVTDEAIPYASIILLGSTRGTSSSINGYFQFELELSSSESNLYISSIGYKDTLVSLHEVKCDKYLEIKLHPKVFQIEGVTIKSKYTNKEIIGSMDYPIYMVNGKSSGFSFSSAGWANGVLISPSKKQAKGLLTSIDVFIADIGPMNCPFTVRIVIPQGKMIENKLLSLSDVTDVTNEPVVFRPMISGWNKIEFYDANILLPDKPFVILFTPLDEGPDCEWLNDEGEKKYGCVIASTRKPKIPQIKWVMGFGERIAYLSDREISNTPMVVINCLTH